jgi:hypothetical protein
LIADSLGHGVVALFQAGRADELRPEPDAGRIDDYEIAHTQDWGGDCVAKQLRLRYRTLPSPSQAIMSVEANGGVR